MTPRRTRSLGLARIVACATLLGAAPWSEGSDEGLIVLAVRPGLAAAQAGLRAGDLLRAWQRGEAGGTLDSAFELMAVELEQAPRGPVVLDLRRDGSALRLTLPFDEWGLEAAPALPADLLEACRAARHAAEQGEGAAALALLERLSAPQDVRGEARWWLLAEQARLRAAAGQAAQARATLEQAAREAGLPAVQARLWARLGDAFRVARDLASSEDAWSQALALDSAAAPEGLARLADVERLAWARHQLGARHDETLVAVQQALEQAEHAAPRSLLLARLLDQVGRMSTRDESAEALRRALELKEQVAPGSLGLADTLHQLAFRSRGQEQLDLAQRSLAIRERWAPDSSVVAASLLLVSQALAARGELRAAAAHDRRALAIRERLEPDTYALSNALITAAINQAALGELGEAERLYRRAAEIERGVRPGSIHQAAALFNLGSLLLQQRDLQAAEEAFTEAGRIAERESPTGNLLPRIVMGRGIVAAERGALAEAEEQLRRAVALFTPAGPATRGGALEELARLLARRGELQEAESLLRGALAALGEDQHRPIRAALQASLGELLARQGDLSGAEPLARSALAAYREIAPGTIRHAEASHALGQVLGRGGRRAEALQLLREAVDALEEQCRRLGGSYETRALFRAHYQPIYRSLEQALLESGRLTEAFEAVERSRARALVSALAARDLDFGRDVPAALEDERRRLDADYDRALEGLAAPALDAAGRAQARARLEALRLKRQEARARIRAAAPRLAALRDPQPLDLAGVRSVLPRGALLLVYSLGETASRVYALGPGDEGLTVAPLPAAEAELRDEVRRFRELVSERRTPLLQGGLRAASGRLGRSLLEPVAARLARAERLIVVPDGPLNLLPFAALGLPGGRFLVEALPVSSVSSISLFASLAQQPRGSGPVVGFGDPFYGPSGPGPEGTSTQPRVFPGRGLAPLPRTRQEVQALTALSPGPATLYLGREATEARARALPRDTSVVHFACHGVLDEGFPLESGLALASPEPTRQASTNGLLQAWEVLENVRLDADLVTLSACQTGLGEELAGDGLLGLTWAFQYAGARSVVASLWEVGDASTALLMRHFYRELGAGRAKAEALRRAQLGLLRAPATSAPWFWAAFALIGDGS